jgi:hypothetical protein
MKFFRSNQIKLFFGVLLLAALACQSTANNSSATETPGALVQVTSGPGGASTQSANAPVSLPAKRADQAGDPDSSITSAQKKAAGGEIFAQNLFERPFNANTMDTYFPYLDIVDLQGFKDDTWGYATITLSNADANGHLPGKYGVELDLNKDGRGDWLILASNPSSTTWTTQGVQAWKDTDGDVGGTTPIFADKKVSTGDGYETLVFDQGKNDNTDEAWVRISPDDPKTVLIAFKLSMLGNPASYAMGGWAGTDALNPAMFDLNDHMTHKQAGSPLPDLTYYPIKGLAEIDNTCRLAIAFTPTGKEPGLCKNVQQIDVVPTLAPTPVPHVCTNFCKYGYFSGWPTCICLAG